jgi:hypothetical protein
MPKLEHVLQALIDSGINITITGLWDDGMDFSFVSLKSAIAHDTDHPEDIEPGEVVDWQNVRRPSMLADAIDAKARQMFPDSGYAGAWRSRNAPRKLAPSRFPNSMPAMLTGATSRRRCRSCTTARST